LCPNGSSFGEGGGGVRFKRDPLSPYFATSLLEKPIFLNIFAALLEKGKSILITDK
jgi:hypothetical protein